MTKELKEETPKGEDEEGKEEEVDEAEETKEDEEGKEEEAKEEAEDADVEEAATKFAEKVSVALDLKGLQKKIEKLTKKSEIGSQIFSPADVKKEKESMSKEEIIVGFFQGLLKNDKSVLKALSEGVAADGGYLFPDEFRAELIRDLADPTRMRGLVRVIPMKKDILKVPRLGSRPQVRWTSENAAKSTTTADFDDKTLTAYKVAAILYASEELIEDCTEFDVVKLIIGLFAERLAEEEDKVITVGTGVGQPTGIDSCTITTISCVGNLNFDDIINLIYSLPGKYRPRAKFPVNNSNIRDMRKLKDGNNRYLWQDAVAPGQPATFHGYPVIENNWLGDDVMYFGDYKSGYWLGDRKRMTVKVSDIAGEAWEHDQIGIRVVERIGGNCVLENAMRKLDSI